MAKVKNIILMGTVAQNLRDIIFYQYRPLPSVYATHVLDKNHRGLISIGQMAKNPVFLLFLHLPYSLLRTNNSCILSTTYCVL
jgi:hypothetical protein